MTRHNRHSPGQLVFAAVLLGAAVSRAEPQGAAAPPDPPARSPARRAGAAGASVVPGVILHGSGHWVLGKTTAARRLLAMQGAGVGLVLLGGVPLVLTGANRYLVGPSAAIVAAGVGLFAISFAADLYGVIVPEDERGTPLLLEPFVQTELGYRYVFDPQFSYRNFLVNGVDVRASSWRVAPSMWFALDDRNVRARALAGYRLFGRTPERRARDGSRLDIEAAATHHRFGTDGFATTTTEAFIGGRLDLARIAPSLHGAFAEMGAGWALSTTSYDLPRADPGNDVRDLLLFRFGYGVYLGKSSDFSGEVLLYYDHRHDDFAAGLQIPGLGSGVAGHFGLSAIGYAGELGLLADLQAGSAYIAGLSLLYRYPEPPR